MPDCLSLERLADKFGPVLESGNFDFRSVLIHLSNKSGSKLFMKQYDLCCTPAVLLRVWSFGTCQAEVAYGIRPH